MSTLFLSLLYYIIIFNSFKTTLTHPPLSNPLTSSHPHPPPSFIKLSSVNSDCEYDGELDQALDDYLELGYTTSHDNTDHCTTDDKECGGEVDEEGMKKVSSHRKHTSVGMMGRHGNGYLFGNQQNQGEHEERGMGSRDDGDEEDDDDDEFGEYDRVDDDDDMDDNNPATTIRAHETPLTHTYQLQPGSSSQETMTSRDSCDSDLSDLAGLAAASSAAFCGVFLPSVAYLNEPLALTNNMTTTSTSTSMAANGIIRDTDVIGGEMSDREGVRRDTQHQNNTMRTNRASTITTGIVYPPQNNHPTHHSTHHHATHHHHHHHPTHHNHPFGLSGTSSGLGGPQGSPCLLTSASLSGGFMRINSSLYARKKTSPSPSTDDSDDDEGGEEKSSRFCLSPSPSPGPGSCQVCKENEGGTGNGTTAHHSTNNGITGGTMSGDDTDTNTDGNLDRLAWQRNQNAQGDWAEVDFSAVKMLLLNVASSHRRATAELNEKLVEDRMRVMAALAEAQLSSSSSSTSSASSSPPSLLIITIPIGQCCSTAVTAVSMHALRSDGRTTPQPIHPHNRNQNYSNNSNSNNDNNLGINHNHLGPFDCLWETLISETQPSSHPSSTGLHTRTPSPLPPSPLPPTTPQPRSKSKHGRDENMIRREVRKALLTHITELLDATTASSVVGAGPISATTTATASRTTSTNVTSSDTKQLPLHSPPEPPSRQQQQQRVVHVALAPVLQVQWP